MEDRACRDGIWLSEQSNTSRSWECDQEKPLRAEHGRRGSLSNCSAYSSGKCGILSMSSSGSKFYSFSVFIDILNIAALKTVKKCKFCRLIFGHSLHFLVMPAVQRPAISFSPTSFWLRRILAPPARSPRVPAAKAAW